MKYLDKLIEHAINNPNEWGGTLSININENRSTYESVDEYVSKLRLFGEDDLSDEDIKHIQKSRTMVEIQYCSNTPVGSYYSLKATAEEAAKEIWESLEKD